MAAALDEPIGFVLRSNTSGFSIGARVQQLGKPAFGSVVKAQPRAEDREWVYGLLYDIHIDDDPMVRQLVLADAVSEETIRDQHHHRIVPVEISILSIGYMGYEGQIRHSLPPRPPLSLDPVYLCGPDEIRQLTGRFDYFRLVLTNAQIASEQLLAANLLIAASTYPQEEQYEYLVRAGREAARLLTNDMPKLDNLLRLLYTV
jgi:hypothetical protein